MRRILALLTLLAPGSALAATWSVATDGSGDFSTISEAIAAASSGDRVEVAAGTYAEAIDFDGKDLIVVGVDGSAATILEGGSVLNTVTFESGESSDALLEGFTIHNDAYRGMLIAESDPTIKDVVFEDLNAGSLNGGAVFLRNSESRFYSCVFQDNSASSGGHVYMNMGAVKFVQTTFSGGVASNQGGAIYADSGSISLDEVLIEENESYSVGGAISLNSRVSLDMNATELSDNHSEYGNGAGVYGWGNNDISIDESTFTGNYPYEYASGYGGGALYMTSGTLSVSDSAFDANYAYYGAGMMLYTTVASFENVSFTSNYAYYGGALYLSSTSTLDDEGGIYDTNTSYYYGAAIYAYYHFDLSFSGSVFNENAAYYGYGGAVYAQTYGVMHFEDVDFTTNYAYYAGGAIYGYDLEAEIKVDRCTFTENTATYSHGGGIYAYYLTNVVVADSEFTYNEAYYSGGALYGYYYGGMTVTNSTFKYNAATNTSGGAIWFDPYVAGYSLLFVGNEVRGNVSRYEGGGVYARSGTSVTIQGNQFIENTLEDDSFGGGLHASNFQDLTLASNIVSGNNAIIGGGVYLGEGVDESSTALIYNNAISDNGADRIGGGVAAVTVGSLSVQNNTFAGNQAAQGGGAFYAYDSPADVRNNIFLATIDGAALSLDGADALTQSSVQYNDLWSNPAGDIGGDLATVELDPTNLTVDPELSGYSLNGDPDDDTFSLSLTSPCIDAGDPTILDSDGTVSDLGYYGGPFGVSLDQDGDGYAEAFDCDDGDGTIYPGASETWYDGVDGDCSGGSDYDQDGDGHDTVSGNGDDCDDADPDVVECPPEPEDTGDTAETDTGKQDTSEPEPAETGEAPPADTATGKVSGCACSAGPSSAPGAMILGLALAAAARRRRR